MHWPIQYIPGDLEALNFVSLLQAVQESFKRLIFFFYSMASAGFELLLCTAGFLANLSSETGGKNTWEGLVGSPSVRFVKYDTNAF